MRRWLNCCCVIVCVLIMGLSAATSPLAADPNCRCRLFGEYFDIGSIMCIRGSLRRCEMNQNNTSWKQIGDICPQASLDHDALLDHPRQAYAARVDNPVSQLAE